MSTVTAWAWAFVVPSALCDDEPMLAAYIDRQRDEALLAALAQGVQLDGEPTSAVEPLVLVDDWSEAGPQLVHEDIARAAGSDAPVSAHHITLTWRV